MREVQGRRTCDDQPLHAGARRCAVACSRSHCKAQFPRTRFVLADADYLPELAGDVRYTPTFSFYLRGRKVDEFVGTDVQTLRDRAWLWSQ